MTFLLGLEILAVACFAAFLLSFVTSFVLDGVARTVTWLKKDPVEFMLMGLVQLSFIALFSFLVYVLGVAITTVVE